MIKRTFYQESIISGTNVDLPQLEQLLDAQSPQTPAQTTTSTFATTSSSTAKLTTRVTLNMRQLMRRLSDAATLALEHSSGESPRMADVRHSVCGPHLNAIAPTGAETTSGRSLGEIIKCRDDDEVDRSQPPWPIHAYGSQLQMSNLDISRIKMQSAKVSFWPDVRQSFYSIELMFDTFSACSQCNRSKISTLTMISAKE